MGNLWKLSKDPISRRGHHRWFWGIRISYLRYVNYLQPGLHPEKYRNLAVKNFQVWSLTLDPIQSSTIWTSANVLEDEKLLRWRRLEDVLKTCFEDVLKIYLEDVLKTYLEDVLNWRHGEKSIFHKSISDNSEANPKCIN